MSAQPMNRQPTPQVVAKLLRIYCPEGPNDLKPALAAAQDFFHLALSLQSAVARRLTESLPASLHCVLAIDPSNTPVLQVCSNPNEHLLSVLSDLPTIGRLPAPMASSNSGMPLLRLDLNDAARIEALAASPLKEIAQACAIHTDDLLDWLHESPQVLKCAHEGCTAFDIMPTALVRNVHPYHAAQLRRATQQDRWYCATHRTQQFTQFGRLSDGLARKLAMAEASDFAELPQSIPGRRKNSGLAIHSDSWNGPYGAPVVPSTTGRASWHACVGLSPDEIWFLAGLGILDHHGPEHARRNGHCLSAAGRDAISAWRDDRQRRRCEDAEFQRREASAALTAAGVKMTWLAPQQILNESPLSVPTRIATSKGHIVGSPEREPDARSHGIAQGTHWVATGEQPVAHPSGRRSSDRHVGTVPLVPQTCAMWMRTGVVFTCKSAEGLSCMNCVVSTDRHVLCSGCVA